MFNAYFVQKIQRAQEQQLKYHHNLNSWKNKYKTEIQPALISKYNRRINGFAKKMEDDPVRVRNLKDGTTDDILARKNDKKQNISKENFLFKNEKDWRSIYSPMKRIQRETIMQRIRDQTERNSCFRSINSQSQYKKQRVQYRDRSKEKQINPPMRYTNKNSQFVFNAIILPKLKNKYRNKIKNKTEGVNNSNDNSNGKDIRKTSITLDDDTQNFSRLDFDTISVGNSHGFKRSSEPQNKTEKDIIEEQEMKALAQNKLYFKSLIDLQQNVGNAKQRYQIKQILVSCGIFKPQTGKVYQEEQVDRFLQMMKTKQ